MRHFQSDRSIESLSTLETGFDVPPFSEIIFACRRLENSLRSGQSLTEDNAASLFIKHMDRKGRLQSPLGQAGIHIRSFLLPKTFRQPENG
jgi:hypothetical protein